MMYNAKKLRHFSNNLKLDQVLGTTITVLASTNTVIVN